MQDVFSGRNPYVRNVFGMKNLNIPQSKKTIKNKK